jgi:1,2-dihydroxy-3-keto-5-methylthiopentene dioxygenase
MTISAWLMDDDTEADQRLPHRTDPVQEVSKDKLVSLGVLFWEGLKGEDDPRVEEIKQERGYNYSDVITCCPDKLPGYETKIKSFFEEHIHTDEEIRYCIDGSGYFDIRDEEDRWVRIELQAGDMIILPEGIMHRFTMDTNNYIQAMRLFMGEPVWTPYPRSTLGPDNQSVQKYKEMFIEKNKRQKTEA